MKPKPRFASTPETARTRSDYSLTGMTSRLAVESGLAEADWYQSYVPGETMQKLLTRRDGPAMRDTALWLLLLTSAAYASIRLWPSWWFVVPYAIYAVLYASTSDSRWHEAGHGTAFRTDWMNNALYEFASFLVLRESVVWRWSHARHHSDTIIVGRDPEIAVPRPPSVWRLVISVFNLTNYTHYFRHILLHAVGRISPEEATFVPNLEHGLLFRNARIYVAIYSAIVVSAILSRSILPLLLIGLPNLFGTWLMLMYGHTQHTGLAENVLDHRLNCRTVYMGRIHRFLYWNMNYHLEHHMFPMVPYHALPALHAAVKDDCPPPYPGLLAAWREIVPAVLRQFRDPSHHVKRTLPAISARNSGSVFMGEVESNGWLRVCRTEQLRANETLRLDRERRTYVLARDGNGQVHALDGMCTHGNVHLSTGLVKDQFLECSKHNGRFSLKDGSPARTPVCRGLAVYPVQEREGHILVDTSAPFGAGCRPATKSVLKVISTRSVATFIREIVLKVEEGSPRIDYEPGDYLQVEIPVYEEISFSGFDIEPSFRSVWERHGLLALRSRNPFTPRENNYSLASNKAREDVLRLNVRIATPPPGQACDPGVGSSYMYNLKPGDKVRAAGPFGDFHLKPTQREMVYIGGGAGMAPLRAHVSHLFETERTARKVSFWYGARSRQELFYSDYFQDLRTKHRNFAFHEVLSAPLPEDAWSGPTGFVHEAVYQSYIDHHSDPSAVEYYLCGPPMMIKACTKMLRQLGVPPIQIAYDEY